MSSNPPPDLGAAARSRAATIPLSKQLSCPSGPSRRHAPVRRSAATGAKAASPAARSRPAEPRAESHRRPAPTERRGSTCCRIRPPPTRGRSSRGRRLSKPDSRSCAVPPCVSQGPDGPRALSSCRPCMAARSGPGPSPGHFPRLPAPRHLMRSGSAFRSAPESCREALRLQVAGVMRCSSERRTARAGRHPQATEVESGAAAGGAAVRGASAGEVAAGEGAAARWQGEGGSGHLAAEGAAALSQAGFAAKPMRSNFSQPFLRRR